ncbi:MAG TPA: hypothetical protein PKI94_04000 [Candidatus Gastranaerophilaceae bacterium]|nr:hypothetical protein [Candidatus Gastranaerophilaceae bacterium]
MKRELIKYFKSLGIEVKTTTKARGHQGFFRQNRIDISKNVKDERIIPTLLHEFAHYIHAKIEPNMPKTGGGVNILFNLSPVHPFTCSALQNELLHVTRFVDENSHLHKLYEHREQIKAKIKVQENIVKTAYPDFMRSKKFKDFDKYIKKSKAKYLLRYDRVKFVSPFLRRVEIFSVDKLEQDFPDMPAHFCAYIRMKSLQKKQARNSRRINYYNKYYSKPSELFARFVEGLYIDGARVRALAPNTTQRFFELLEAGYYFELKNVLEMLQQNEIIANS